MAVRVRARAFSVLFPDPHGAGWTLPRPPPRSVGPLNYVCFKHTSPDKSRYSLQRCTRTEQLQGPRGADATRTPRSVPLLTHVCPQRETRQQSRGAPAFTTC